MKKLLFLICTLISLPTIAQSFKGSWIGTLDIQGTKLNIVFHFKQNDNIWSGTIDSPDQGAYGLKIDEVVVDGQKISTQSHQIQMTFSGELQQDTIKGTFKQGPLSLPLVLTPQIKELTKEKPQTPKEPYPYNVREMTVSSQGDSVVLSGTLTIPSIDKKHPAIILIAGSGPMNRDEEIFGHKPFAVLADYFTRQDFAVFRYDKRGIGKSTGNYKIATTCDFAEDVKSIVATLSELPNIDDKNIGLIGHSEGGIIAPMVANEMEAVKYIVLLAAPGLQGKVIVKKQNEELIQNTPIANNIKTKYLNVAYQFIDYLTNDNEPKDSKENIIAGLNSIIKQNQADELFPEDQRESLVGTMTTKWYMQFLKLNPATYLTNIKCPTLALNGDIDKQVDADTNLKAIERAMSGNQLLTVKKYPQLNHLFQHAEKGTIDEYAKIKETFSEEVIKDILTWITQDFKL